MGRERDTRRRGLQTPKVAIIAKKEGPPNLSSTVHSLCLPSQTKHLYSFENHDCCGGLLNDAFVH
jgi:hypothetical protein